MVSAALLSLHVHRMVQAAPWLSNSALRPVAPATMASADFSPPVGCRCRPPAPVVWKAGRSPRVRQCSFPRAPADLPSWRTAGFRASPSDAGSPHHAALYPLPVRRLRGLPPASSPRSSRRRSCHGLTVPAMRPVEDLHLQDHCHAWHTSWMPTCVGKTLVG